MNALMFVFLSEFLSLVQGLGSMASIAISYGESGSVFCGLKNDGSHSVSCHGSNSDIVYGAPTRFSFAGLTAGDGFVCGLLIESMQPYCWGNSLFIQTGVPQPMKEGSKYVEISAGDHHLCAMKKSRRRFTNVDCWGYNMTNSHVFEGKIQQISAGSGFNCGLFVRNQTAFCWGDDTNSGIISSSRSGLRFRKIAAGGYHVCGIAEDDSKPVCWGRSLSIGASESYNGESVVSIVGGKFHSCGIKEDDHGVTCWGLILNQSSRVPAKIRVSVLAAGDYFTCGVMARSSLQPVCWGVGFPSSLPLAVAPGVCSSSPCSPGFYEFIHGDSVCRNPNLRMCLPCKNNCSMPECSSNCSSRSYRDSYRTSKLAFIAAGLILIIIFFVFSCVTVVYIRHRLKNCHCNNNMKTDLSSSKKTEMEDFKIQRARIFTYRELEKATGGFIRESEVGRGSFSSVFKGVLKDGRVVAVKRPIFNRKNFKEFLTELDLLSRLNHAHLLNLLGYCVEGGEGLLVYEFMSHGTLHRHLHGDRFLKLKLDWSRRVTIAVQAARGIEYLHGYACPPVIHRDIKSSNILIDEEHNARVSDFGLSLLGPANSSSPLAELPAGTLGYLDPEYYRLHYLTTKSDVYSFGVLLLEILTGRKAIDLRFEDGNIVEWAIPRIKSRDIASILDPVLKPPPDLEPLIRIANVACKCVRMRAKERPSMEKVTTALERALAILLGNPCNEQPILPSEVVLGSSRFHKKSSRSSNHSGSEGDDQKPEYRAPSWITFPSVTSSQRRKSSASEADAEVKNAEVKNFDQLRRLEEEIGPASPQQELFLQHNF